VKKKMTMQNSIIRIVQMLCIIGLAAYVASCQSNCISQDTQACKPATTARASFAATDLRTGILPGKSVSQTVPTPRCGTNTDQIAEYVRRIFLDSYGNYWLGTNALGVFRYFNGESNYISLEEGLGGTQVTGIIEDKKGRIWVANSGGVAVIDGIHIKNYGKESGLKNDRLWCVLEDSKGTIWVGGEDGVYTFNGERFEPFVLPFCKSPEEMKKESPLRVSALTEDSKGNIWIGTEGKGALRFDGEKFTTFDMEEGLVDNHIVCILEDKKGNIWFSSRFHGLGFYDGKNFTNFLDRYRIG
jgi:ligand-binding sensor domain-containing protein